MLMTSFAFVLGVIPLVLAEGHGAEMRLALGTSVCSGMLGVTFLGLLLTPVFYVVVRWFIERKRAKQARQPEQSVPHLSHAILLLLVGGSLRALASGCQAVGPDYTPPAVQAPSAFANEEQPGLSTVDVEVTW
jgi:drug/metabolite transporter (DMT)-like permease